MALDIIQLISNLLLEESVSTDSSLFIVRYAPHDKIKLLIKVSDICAILPCCSSFVDAYFPPFIFIFD